MDENHAANYRGKGSQEHHQNSHIVLNGDASSRLSADDSSLEPGDELNGEILHCLFPGCMKG